MLDDLLDLVNQKRTSSKSPRSLTPDHISPESGTSRPSGIRAMLGRLFADDHGGDSRDSRGPSRTHHVRDDDSSDDRGDARSPRRRGSAWDD